MSHKSANKTDVLNVWFEHGSHTKYSEYNVLICCTVNASSGLFTELRHVDLGHYLAG